MAAADDASARRNVDPADRFSELVFGILMAMSLRP